MRLRASVTAVVAVAVLLQVLTPVMSQAAILGVYGVLVTVTAGGAAAAYGKRARAERGRLRAALLLGAMSAGAWSIANAFYPFAIPALDVVADCASLAAAVLLPLPLFLLTSPERGLDAVRKIVDIAAVAGALLSLAWIFVLHPAWRLAAGSAAMDAAHATVLAVPEVIAAAITVITVARSAPGRGSHMPRLLGAASLALAGSVLASLGNSTRNVPWYTHGVVGGYLLATGLMAVSSRQESPRAEPVSLQRMVGGVRAALPYVPIVLAVLAAAVQQVRTGTLEAELVWMLLGTFSVVLLRQFLTLTKVSGLALTLERQQEALAHQALHDPLTGLANRTAFAAAADRVAGVIMLLDLDGFKPVNDTYGHAAGDEVLVAAARRLAAAVRPGDLVARIGGDEFAVLLRGASADEGRATAARMLASLAEPIVTRGVPVTVGGSIGLTEAPPAGEEAVDSLLRKADLAMYAAKAAGKGKVRVYDPLRVG